MFKYVVAKTRRKVTYIRTHVVFQNNLIRIKTLIIHNITKLSFPRYVSG